ncbi:hypothetical protein GCM10022221_39580 [Actinocorallia aurea]
MIDAVFFSVAAAAFAAAMVKGRDLRRGPERAGQRALCLLLVTLGSAFVVLSDTAQAVESRIFPNLGRLLSNICTLLAALGIVAHLLSVSYPASRARAAIRRLSVGYAIAIAVMAVSFLSSPVPARVGDFGDRSVAGGAVAALAYLAEKFVFVQSKLLDIELPLAGHEAPCPSAVQPVGCLFSVAFPAVAVLLIVVGMTVPAWGPALAAPLRWWTDRRLHTRLEPLWRLLYEAFPQIVMPGTAHLGARWRLQRRVIEIRDGLTALSPYRESGAREAADAEADTAQVGATRRAAVIEATLIALSLAEHRKNNPAERRDELVPPDGDPADLTGEAVWLADIAAALPTALTLQKATHVR